MTTLDAYVCFKPALQVTSVADAGKGPVPAPASSRFLMDPGSACALESALALRELGEIRHVICISVGPESFDPALAWCKAAGADEVLRVDVPSGINLDARAAATLLANTIQDLSGKLVMTGQRSVDESNGLVAAVLASRLEAAFLSNAADVQILEGEVKVSRRVERGHRQLWNASLPAVVAVDPEPQNYRYVSVANLALAKHEKVKTLAASTETLAGIHQPTVQTKLTPGRARTRQSGLPATGGTAADRIQTMMGTTSKTTDGQQVLSGDIDDLAEQALTFLKNKGLLPGSGE